jgi:hypothetical protein
VWFFLCLGYDFQSPINLPEVPVDEKWLFIRSEEIKIDWEEEFKAQFAKDKAKKISKAGNVFLK